MLKTFRRAALLGFFLLALLSLRPFHRTLHAATVVAASCSRADVQTAIDAAIAGDTVTVPAGTCTWTSPVTITDKALTLTGSRPDRTLG